jgi:hypothetical protein
MRSITDEIKEWPEGKSLVTDWAEKLLKCLFGNFKDLKASHEAHHPKLVGWLCRFGGLQRVEYGEKQHLAD